MASKIPTTGSVPTVHVAGVAPPVQKGKPDPCRHRRDEKAVFVVYKAQEEVGNPPKKTGNYYVGRTRGATADQAKNNRERGHHRTDIGKLQVVCVTDSYSACRGAEQKHYVATKNKITSPKSKGKGAQIAPIAADNPNKKDYEDCAKLSAQNAVPQPGCAICAA